MIDFNDEKNAIGITIFPFVNTKANDWAAFDILNSASKCKESFETLSVVLQRQESDENITDEIVNQYISDYIFKSCNVFQTTVNLLAAMFGNNEEAQKAVNACIIELTKGNIAGGHYGEVEDEQEEQEEQQEEEQEQED
jgi:hypothetical protein